MGLLFTLTTNKVHLEPALTNKSTVAESKSIGANHLGFAKSLFQHYCQHLELNYNQISAESAFNFYVNERIAYLLGTPINTKSARETFYHELIQNTSLPTNYNFASIITKINKEIEHYIQQSYPITYASKGKKKLQTLAVTSQQIQPPTWKKHRIKLPINSSYHYTPRNAINIASTGVFTLNMTSTFEQFLFQRIQIEITNVIRKSTELEKKQKEEEKKESEDQEFTYQNLITKNLNIKTPNFQTQQDQNLENPEIETLPN
ncbi:hypothetical protein G9A89_008864 [Geosiphon pyriformis]|nr:hypothetical protein G9A89_008864 [Geosiphon pyriformis]